MVVFSVQVHEGWRFESTYPCMYTGAGMGSYAEERLIAADKLVKIPNGVDDVSAAAIILKGMTTQILIHKTFKVPVLLCPFSEDHVNGVCSYRSFCNFGCTLFTYMYVKTM
jgi:NADPH:quinone reductase-like Zn-dependent oxidoreductase